MIRSFLPTRRRRAKASATSSVSLVEDGGEGACLWLPPLQLRMRFRSNFNFRQPLFALNAHYHHYNLLPLHFHPLARPRSTCGCIYRCHGLRATAPFVLLRQRGSNTCVSRLPTYPNPRRTSRVAALVSLVSCPSGTPGQTHLTGPAAEGGSCSSAVSTPDIYYLRTFLLRRQHAAAIPNYPHRFSTDE